MGKHVDGSNRDTALVKIRRTGTEVEFKGTHPLSLPDGRLRCAGKRKRQTHRAMYLCTLGALASEVNVFGRRLLPN